MSATTVERSTAACTAPNPLAVEVRGVGVAFGGARALTDVTTSVNVGDVVAVVGPNGAGKTTFLNAICGLAPKDSGVVRHLGRDISDLGPTRIAQGGIGRSFQDPKLVDSSTVLQNILTGAHTSLGYSVGSQIVRRRHVAQREHAVELEARALLEMVGMGDLADRRADQLAYGPRKIIDILRAVICRPDVLLLDEPSSGLDLIERGLVEHTLLQLHREFDLTMILVEHHFDLVRAVANKVLCLASGSVAVQGATEQVLDSAEFKATIAGEEPPSTSKGDVLS